MTILHGSRNKIISHCKTTLANSRLLPTPKGCGLYGLFDKVTISYESFGSEKSFDDLLELTAKVYEGLSADDIDGIEKIAHGRRDFFGDRTGA